MIFSKNVSIEFSNSFLDISIFAGPLGPSMISDTLSFDEDPVFEAIKKNSYESFVKKLLQEREQMDLPPYSFTAILRVESKQLIHGEKFIIETAKYAKSLKKISLRHFSALLCVTNFEIALGHGEGDATKSFCCVLALTAREKSSKST